MDVRYCVIIRHTLTESIYSAIRSEDNHEMHLRPLNTVNVIHYVSDKTWSVAMGSPQKAEPEDS